MRNRKKYPKNWKLLALACKIAAGWKCEKCGVEHGSKRISNWSLNEYTVYMQAAHVNHDFDNPNPVLACVCCTCHWRYYRKNTQLPQWYIERLKHRQLLKKRGVRLKPINKKVVLREAVLA